jgi:LysM repeat protein
VSCFKLKKQPADILELLDGYLDLDEAHREEVKTALSITSSTSANTNNGEKSAEKGKKRVSDASDIASPKEKKSKKELK